LPDVIRNREVRLAVGVEIADRRGPAERSRGISESESG
jgi:hypothetical protein